MEQYNLEELARLSGNVVPTNEKKDKDGKELPVQDGDNDSSGYQYDADTYNMFGDEDQEMRNVPARYADNPLKDPVTENKSLFDYLRDIENKE